MKKFSYTRTGLHLFLLVLTIWLLFYVYAHLADLGMDYEWQWNRAWRYFGKWTKDGFSAGPLLDGLLLTLGIAFAGLIASTLTGFIASILRLSPWPLCHIGAKAYISIFRNTPLLIQLFFIYFLVSPIFNLSPFWSAVLALGLFEGSYICELLRGALLGIPRHQWEASLSLGFSLSQTLFIVILPQALRHALPAFTNQAVALIKDTTLVSAIALADLTMQAQAIVAETFLAFEIWLLVAFIYICLTLCISMPGLWLERKQLWQ